MTTAALISALTEACNMLENRTNLIEITSPSTPESDELCRWSRERIAAWRQVIADALPKPEPIDWWWIEQAEREAIGA